MALSYSLALITACAATAATVLAAKAANAEETDKTLAPVLVTDSPYASGEDAMMLTPAKVLSGNELRDKIGGSLGSTLSQELGVSASGFSAGASRPVIRGLEGSRVKILENGMSSGDLSAISNDHAVGSSMMSTHQIEILRGPAALLYGSGAIGGLVNIVNDRIPTVLEPRATGETELRYSSVDQGNALGFSADRSAGSFGLHIDGSTMNSGNYRIPGFSNIAGTGDSGRLSFSNNRENNIGVGSSLIQDWGYVGASLSQLDKNYGVHGASDDSTIKLAQTRFDIDSLIKSPFAGFDALRIKLGHNDYQHTELANGTDPSVRYTNQALESRWELSHLPVDGWRGKFGLQSENTTTQAASLDSSPSTVPRTRSSSVASFIVEEHDFGAVRVNAGARYDYVTRRPDADQDRNFALGSYSVGTLWTFTPGYGLGATASVAERAPTAEELYSNGPHGPTSSWDTGNASLKTETSHNLELSLQKTDEKLRWKANIYQNSVKNFVYGKISAGTSHSGYAAMTYDRDFLQGDATLRGIEAEISYNLNDPGWFGRVFADSSEGKLDDLSHLPLQPATRTGLNVGHQMAAWRSSLSLVHAFAHNNIASSSISEETTTKAYTQLDASVTYVQRYGTTDLTWFFLAKNLLNEEIRLSTSLLKDYVPQPGRNFIFGLRTRF